jgi:hypothetical protein
MNLPWSLPHFAHRAVTRLPIRMADFGVLHQNLEVLWCPLFYTRRTSQLTPIT